MRADVRPGDVWEGRRLHNRVTVIAVGMCVVHARSHAGKPVHIQRDTMLSGWRLIERAGVAP